MKKLALVALILAGLLSTSNSANARGRRGHCGSSCNTGCGTGCDSGCGNMGCGDTACGTSASYEERQVTAYRAEWKEREVKMTVNRMVQREEVVPQKVSVCVPVWTEEKRTCTVYHSVPRQVTRDVCCSRMVPHCETDPCTGCTRTCCRPETYVQHVTSTVMDCVPAQQEYSVRVCHYRTEERTVETRRVVCEMKPEVVTHRERFCTMVPYQTTVKVPVCAPAATCGTGCGTGCGSGCGTTCGSSCGQSCGGCGECGGSCGECGGRGRHHRAGRCR